METEQTRQEMETLGEAAARLLAKLDARQQEKSNARACPQRAGREAERDRPPRPLPGAPVNDNVPAGERKLAPW